MSQAEHEIRLSRRALVKGAAGATVGGFFGFSSPRLPETSSLPLFSRDETMLTADGPSSQFVSSVPEALKTANGEFQQTYNDEQFGQLLQGIGNQLISQELPKHISPKEFDASISEIEVQSSNAHINLTGKVHEKAVIIPHTDTITAEILTDPKSGEVTSVTPNISGSVASKILDQRGINTEDIASALQNPNEKIIKGLNLLFENKGITVDTFKLDVHPQEITVHITGQATPSVTPTP